MSLNVTTGDVDIRQVMTALKGYDKRLQKQTRAKIARSARIIVNAARANTPAEPPMSGWRVVAAKKGVTRGGAGWPPWINVRKGISYRIGRQTRIRATNSIRWDLVRVVQRTAPGVIYEFAAQSDTAQGSQFIANLNRRRTPARAMWPAVDQHKDAVTRDMMDAVRAAAAEMNRLK